MAKKRNRKNSKKAVFRKFATTAATTSLLVSPMAPAANVIAETAAENNEPSTEQVVDAPEAEVLENIELPEEATEAENPVAETPVVEEEITESIDPGFAPVEAPTEFEPAAEVVEVSEAEISGTMTFGAQNLTFTANQLSGRTLAPNVVSVIRHDDNGGTTPIDNHGITITGGNRLNFAKTTRRSNLYDYTRSRR